ncbi:MAG TPA: DNA repair protein RadA [Candidatus Rikenella faecigallinarum]|uniref:DNA repair protein RadA n=1 Tax=Candidatus Rikenella faecigallinarum TaxID=2838745 RepID=A0A9D1QEL3_9BACT|nr:DNA repair protein RadA [Candidatus Rikenella faecigallinarum]
MAKLKKSYFCTSCGNESPKWLGRCPACGEWNTYTEELVAPKSSRNDRTAFGYSTGLERNRPIPVKQVERSNFERIDLLNNEVNRVLGGGLVPGSLVLLGGEPGIGKSTLALQIAVRMADTPILYVSGEESPEQIKMRADRLGIQNEQCLLLSETSLENILMQLTETAPRLVVIDSIQTLYSERVESSPGSISQVRECAAMLLKYAKESRVPVLIIGHITKEGSIAGPKILEHIVDVVFQFEGDSNTAYRILRSIKNRFGATNEIGVFEMRNEGLREVDNPSEILVSHYDEPLSGIAIGATIEGVRPFLLETQALVSTSAYGTPQRSATGVDYKRLNMLLAVLEKRLGFKLGTKDVFLNLAGGFKVADTGLDLAIMAAIISSGLDVALDADICFAGEVGLSGEVRPAARTEQRVSEAARLGFKTIVVSGYARKALSHAPKGIEIIYVNRVDELARRVFGNRS